MFHVTQRCGKNFGGEPRPIPMTSISTAVNCRQSSLPIWPLAPVTQQIIHLPIGSASNWDQVTNKEQTSGFEDTRKVSSRCGNPRLKSTAETLWINPFANQRIPQRSQVQLKLLDAGEATRNHVSVVVLQTKKLCLSGGLKVIEQNHLGLEAPKKFEKK